MAKVEDVAATLVNNWYLHDKHKYKEIERNSAKLLNQLGYKYGSVKVASKIIRGIYEKADLAERYMRKKSEKEEVLYYKMREDCNKLDKILGRQANSKNELLWWKAIRHNNIVLAYYYLFMDQLSKFGNIKAMSAIKATNFLFKAGKAHDKKDWDLCRKETERMLQLLKMENIEKYIEF